MRVPLWSKYRVTASSCTAALVLLAGLLVLLFPAGAAAQTLRPAPSVLSGGDAAPRHAVAITVTQVRKTVLQRLYAVRKGDYLSGIAKAHCHSEADWTGIYLASRKVIGANPDLILPGEILTISCTHPGLVLAVRRVSVPVVTHHYSQGTTVSHSAAAPVYHSAPVHYSSGSTFSYAGLEQLWVSAGGSSAREATAACIAEHESGGNPRAISPTNDWGLWQIHAGGYAMLNPYANAARAVAMSSNGTDWSQWTTHIYCSVL